MKRYTADYILEGITEADFQNWKHHPVTKLILRFYRDYERQLGAQQVGLLRSSSESPDLFKLGTWSGSINTIQEMAEPKYESIVQFYTPEESEEEES